MSRIISFFSNGRLRSGSPGVISAWVGPGYCGIGEFRLRRGVPVGVAWHEGIFFPDRGRLKDSLRAIVKRRWLWGKPVSLSLAVPEMFSVPFDDDAKKPFEEQDILPPGVSWDDVEYATRKEGGGFSFACMRREDLEYWVRFFGEAGFIVGTVAPACVAWSRFFDAAGDISCTLPSGRLVYYQEGKWSGSAFFPGEVPGGRTVAFDAAVRPGYAWCPRALIPALEAVLPSVENPGCNVNPGTRPAVRLRNAECVLNKGIFWGSIGLAGIILSLASIIGVASAWQGSVKERGKPLLTAAVSIKQENKRVQAKLSSYKAILSQKSSNAKILHDVGGLAKDSLWYSECGLAAAAEGGVDAFIVGHSFSETAIAKLLTEAEALPGMKKAALEYTEKLAPDQSDKLTGSRVKCVLYRFKIVFKFAT